MEKYSVKQLSKIAGVSVRTLHVYDKLNLLKPMIRTEAKYRYYGHDELLKLQQILFYKELGFPLKSILEILDDPEFNIVQALESHKASLKQKQANISVLIDTIDKTIIHLKKGEKMLKPEELYEGFSQEQAEEYRKEAIHKYGDESVSRSEKHLQSLKKEDFDNLKQKAKQVYDDLFSIRFENPESEKVQTLIAQHYKVIRQFWGSANSTDKQADAYAGLADLYLNDERFTMVQNKPQPEFASFLNKAMKYFSKRKLI